MGQPWVTDQGTVAPVWSIQDGRPVHDLAMRLQYPAADAMTVTCVIDVVTLRVCEVVVRYLMCLDGSFKACGVLRHIMEFTAQQRIDIE